MAAASIAAEGEDPDSPSKAACLGLSRRERTFTQLSAPTGAEGVPSTKAGRKLFGAKGRATTPMEPTEHHVVEGVEAREYPAMGGRDTGDMPHLRSFGRCRAQHDKERHDASRVRRQLPRLRTNLAVGGLRRPP